MKKDKLLRRLSAMQFAMWEMREFLDKEYEARFGPLTLNGANSDAWLQDPWPWEAGFDTDE